MGWDGAGGYTRVHNFSADASSGINILAARMDAEIDDMASAFTRVWTRDGQNVPTQDLPMGGRKFVNVGAPTSVSNFMRVREFVENVPIFMQDTEASADRISVSSQYFTSVSGNQAPGDGTKIMVRVASNKSSAVLYLDGHSANVEFQDGNRAANAMVSGGIYELTYSSVDTAWKLAAPNDGRTAAEISAGVTPTNYQYPPGDSRRQSITNDSSTDHTTALQAVLDAAAGMVPVHVYKTASSGYIRLTGRVTAPAGTHIVLHDGVELRWTATTASGTSFLGVATRPGIEVTGDNFTIEGRGTLTGPSTATYVANECGIAMFGTTGARKSGFRIRGQVELTKWGAYPVMVSFVNHIIIDGAHIHDSGYIGVHANSCNHGRVQNCRIHDFVGNTNSECHGISLSSDSTDYDLDANASTNGRLAANPFCIDWDVGYNTIYDLPLWTGIDAHGAYDTHFHHNKVYNCRIGILLANNSGDAANYAGEGNSVGFNTVTTSQIDGSATEVVDPVGGIIVNGGQTVKHRGVKVIGNDVEGYGNPDDGSASISAVYVQGAVVEGNSIRSWAGPGVYTAAGDGVIANNTFGSVSDATLARCIYLDTGSLPWNVTSNKLYLNSGTAPAEGLRIATTTVKHTIADNDFDAATTPYIGTTQTLTGAGAVDVVHKLTYVVSSSGPNALTLADGIEGQDKWVVLKTDDGGAVLTPTNLYNGSTLTFDDVGDSAYLKFMDGQWVFMGGTATLA